MDEIFAYLASVSPISEKTWQKAAPLFVKLHLDKFDYFAQEQVVERRFCVLVNGVIRAFYRNSEGQEYNKHFFTPISLVGAYSSLITGQPNRIIQQALTDCTLWTADYAAFCNLFDECRDLERLGRRLAELYFVAKEQREVEIVLLDADKRYEIMQQQHPELEQLVPQYHIASYLGITPTQLSRIRRNRLVRK